MSIQPGGAETVLYSNLKNGNLRKDPPFKMRIKCNAKLSHNPEFYADQDGMKTALSDLLKVTKEEG